MPVYTSGANLARITVPNTAPGHAANGAGYWLDGYVDRGDRDNVDAQIVQPAVAAGGTTQTIDIVPATETDTAVARSATKIATVTPATEADAGVTPTRTKRVTATPATEASATLTPTRTKRVTVTPATGASAALTPTRTKRVTASPVAEADAAITPTTSILHRYSITPAAELDKAIGGAFSYRDYVAALSGIQSYWRLADTTGVMVDEVGAVSLTVGSAIVRGVTGLLGNGDTNLAMQGAASSNSRLTASGAYQFAALPFSVALIIKPSVVNTATDLVGRTSATGVGWKVSTTTAGKIMLQLGGAAGTFQLTNGLVMTPGETYLIVASNTGDTSAGGARCDVVPLTGAGAGTRTGASRAGVVTGTNSVALQVGNAATGVASLSGAFLGVTDELFVLNRVMSTTEVDDLYTATQTTSAEGGISPKKRVTVTPASETDTAVAPGARRHRSITPAAETDAAVTPTYLHPKVTVAPAAETDTALARTGIKRVSITPAAETDTAVAPARKRFISITPATETDTALAAHIASTVTPAAETDAAVTPSARKRVTITPAAETDTAIAPGITMGSGEPTEVTVTPAAETDTAIALAVRKRVTITPAAEVDTALAMVGVGIVPEPEPEPLVGRAAAVGLRVGVAPM